LLPHLSFKAMRYLGLAGDQVVHRGGKHKEIRPTGGTGEEI